MTTNGVKDVLSALFENWSGQAPLRIEALPASGSRRRYFRLYGEDGRTAIGTHNPNLPENETFLYFSKHFAEKGLPVPAIYGSNLEADLYLQEDLGTEALYDLLPEKGEIFPEHLIATYQEVVQQLAAIQVNGGMDLNAPLFDQPSMLWDMHYFKYYYLKLLDVPYQENQLEDDFNKLTSWLAAAGNDHFMFRDFQSRNILLKEGAPFFIDYQGGKKGPLQYDLVSLLWQAKANLPFELRDQMVNVYLDALEKLIPVDRPKFKAFYLGFVLLRTLQVLAVYGLRGLVERKDHFLQSIPFALHNLQWLSEQGILEEYPELQRNVQWILANPPVKDWDPAIGKTAPLLVQISSFSYKKGLPEDRGGHGGGFIFDCRFIHNPGRYAPYKELTGRDQPVKDFFGKESNMDAFLAHVRQIVEPAVENYLERKFDSLSIHFGCTGGQHRSVFAADAISRHLHKKYGIRIQLEHREQHIQEQLGG